jgi:hypothetical protein
MNEQELLQLVRAKEDEIRAQRFESAFFWDWQGNLLLSKDGEPDLVRFTPQEIALVKGSISTHNHPYGWKFSERDPRRAGYSFSENDVKSACHASLSVLRIVTPQFRFMLKAPSQGWNVDYWETTLKPACQQTQAVVRVYLKAQIQARQILQSDGEALFRHLLWTRVATELGLTYSREEF